MKFAAISILSVFILFSCNPKQDNINTDNIDIFEDSLISDNTSYDFPEMDIPEGFYFDTITVYDAASRANYVSYILLSSLPGMKNFNIAMTAAAEKQIRFEQSYVEPYKGDSPTDPIFTYELAPVEFYSDNEKISITHVADTYTEGGNHHNYSWFSFNYDLKKDKVICFSDVFILKSRKDSVAFVEFVIRNEIEDCMDWTLPFDSVDFSFSGSGIFINPELSWACAQNRSFLPSDSLNKYFISNRAKKK